MLNTINFYKFECFFSYVISKRSKLKKKKNQVLFSFFDIFKIKSSLFDKIKKHLILKFQ